MEPVVPLQDLTALVRPELERVNRELHRDLLPGQPELVPMLEHVGRFRGKQLRPALVFLVARALGGVRLAHFTVAKVVELIHVASLVHDDILDDATLRRQLPTLHALHGHEISVLLGDYLYARGFQLSVSLDDPTCSRILADTTRTICQGEIAQLSHRFDFDWTEARYERVIDDKTASLFAAAAQLGAHYAGASAARAAAMAAFGRGLGIAFQIVDDCLDLDGDEAVVGKSLGTDLTKGKLTLPLLYLLQTEPDARPRLQRVLGSDAPLASLREEFDLATALQFSNARAREHVERARAQLTLLPQGPAREALADLAASVVWRSA